MEPWYKVVTPRKEVREGRSFNPDEFAIHLKQHCRLDFLHLANALSALYPKKQRREAPARCHVSGGTEVTGWR